jgi:hypothetical protein
VQNLSSGCLPPLTTGLFPWQPLQVDH